MPELGLPTIEDTMGALNSEDARQFVQICDDVMQRSPSLDLSEVSNEEVYRDAA